MKKFYSFSIFALFFVMSLPAHAGYYAFFNSSGFLTSWGFQPDDAEIVPASGSTPASIKANVQTPSGAVVITRDQYLAAPNLSYSNGTVSIVTPTPPAPTLAQQAATALNAGIAITSTSTPSLDGTYSLSDDAQSNINGIETYILANGNFPGNASTYAYLDQSGAPHVFSSTQEFKAFANAVANLVSALKTVELTNSGTLPSNAATLP